MRVSGCLYVLEQFLCAMSILHASAQILHIPDTKPLRLMLVAFLCALGATLPAIRPHLLLQLGMAALMLLAPAALWPSLPRSLRRLLAPALFFLTLVWTGALRLLHTLACPPWLIIALPCLMLHLCSRVSLRPLPPCATLEIRCGASRITLTALIDTGNLLRDPLTGLPVVVISRRAARRLVPSPLPGALNPGLRQIPIRTVAGASCMAVFRPDTLRMMHQGAWQDVHAVLGVVPDGYDGVQALAPASLMRGLSPSLTQGG